MLSLHSALTQPRLEDSAAAERVWPWGRRGRTAPQGCSSLGYIGPFPGAEAPGEELCFRLCFAERHLLMFD